METIKSVVQQKYVPEAVRRSMELWVGWIAGALEEDSYRDKLTNAASRTWMWNQAVSTLPPMRNDSSAKLV